MNDKNQTAEQQTVQMEEELLKGCEDVINQVLEEHGIDPGSEEAEKIAQAFLNDIQVEDGGKEKRRNILKGVGLFALGGLSVYGVGTLYKKFKNSSNDEDQEEDFEMPGMAD